MSDDRRLTSKTGVTTPGRQANSDPLPYTQIDRAVKPKAALLAGAIGVSTQHAMGSLVEFWELCGDPRELESLILAGREEVVLSAEEVRRRFALASGKSLDPKDMASLGLLEPRGDDYRVRGMSRYFYKWACERRESLFGTEDNHWAIPRINAQLKFVKQYPPDLLARAYDRFLDDAPGAESLPVPGGAMKSLALGSERDKPTGAAAEVAHLRSLVATLEVRLQLLNELYQGVLRRPEGACEMCAQLEAECAALWEANDSLRKGRAELVARLRKLRDDAFAVQAGMRGRDNARESMTIYQPTGATMAVVKPNAAPPAAPAPEATAKPAALPASSSQAVYLPVSVGPHDFFRLKRKGNGWVVEMVRVAAMHERREVWEWSLIDSAERRLLSLASEAERVR